MFLRRKEILKNIFLYTYNIMGEKFEPNWNRIMFIDRPVKGYEPHFLNKENIRWLLYTNPQATCINTRELYAEVAHMTVKEYEFLQKFTSTQELWFTHRPNNSLYMINH